MTNDTEKLKNAFYHFQQVKQDEADRIKERSERKKRILRNIFTFIIDFIIDPNVANKFLAIGFFLMMYFVGDEGIVPNNIAVIYIIYAVIYFKICEESENYSSRFYDLYSFLSRFGAVIGFCMGGFFIVLSVLKIWSIWS